MVRADDAGSIDLDHAALPFFGAIEAGACGGKVRYPA